MRVSDDFILRQVADEYLLVPVGEAALSVKGLIRLSESGCLLFERLRGGCGREDLVRALLEEYDVPAETAQTDVDEFLAQLRGLGMLTEECP